MPDVYPIDLNGGLEVYKHIFSGPPVDGFYKTKTLCLDADGAVWKCTSGGTPGAWSQATAPASPTGQVTRTNAEASAGFILGSVVYTPSPGNVKLAKNNGSASEAQPSGISLGAVAHGATGLIHTYGYANGFSGLTPGPFFLGAAGGIIMTPLDPNDVANNGKYSTFLGYILSASELIFAPGLASQINNA